MKVEELREKLQKYDKDKEVIIRFGLDNEDDIGYILEPFDTGLYFKDECAIYAEYTATKEALREAQEKAKKYDNLEIRIKKDIKRYKTLEKATKNEDYKLAYRMIADHLEEIIKEK